MLLRMAMRFSDTEQLYAYLLGFVNVEKGQATVFKLDRMAELCARAGDPQKAYRTIHIAGSKGKGSVSIMIARILEAAGHRTGLYTSPHILRWKERISLAGNEMPEELILAAAGEVIPLIDGKGPSDFPGGELPTYFELSTLIAFCAFRAAGCDRAVIETGLGGRLDSTNVVDSAASVITAIELEHTEYLGDTIALIAGEKAGIIKPERPCYLAAQKPEAREVFERVAASQGSPLREAPELTEIRDVTISREGTSALIGFAAGTPLSSPLGARFPSPIAARTPMIGSIQAENMALALLASAELEPDLSAAAAVSGLSKAYLPARFQILPGSRPGHCPIVLDGAHTVSSTMLALESFEALFPGPKALLFACAEDKKHAEIAKVLGSRFDRITLTRPGTFKKSDLSALEESFRAAGAAYRAVPDHEEAIARARAEAAELALPLLVTGSFYLCAEFLKSYERGGN
jgi:dihydrofolate synthase / folylpolyglutamate synthase